jgi:hypothetical protein
MANITITHTETHDETKPAGTRARSLGDDDIREFKRTIRERLAIDHQFAADESGNSAIGTHKKITFSETQASDPTAYDDCGYLYIKTVSGQKELFWMDDNGNVVQLTTGGVIKDSVLAKTGDWMVSSVATARAGWTNVSATYSNKFMRINATPLTTGGSDTHTTPSHTLTTAEMPAHSHTQPVGGASGGGTMAYIGQVASGFTPSTNETGGGGGHTHDAADNVPAYVQVVIFQKD